MASLVAAAGELQLQQRNDAHPSTSFSMSAGELLRTNCFHMHCKMLFLMRSLNTLQAALDSTANERFPTSTICLRLTVVYVCEILLQKKILSPGLTFIFLEIFFMAGMHAPDDETSRSSTLTFSFLLARAQGEAKAPGFYRQVNT